MLICMHSRGLPFSLFCFLGICQILCYLCLSPYFLCLFPRSVLQEVLDQKDKFHSLKQDVLPYLVRSQMVSLIALCIFNCCLRHLFPLSHICDLIMTYACALEIRVILKWCTTSSASRRNWKRQSWFSEQPHDAVSDPC